MEKADGTDRLSRNVGKKLPATRCIITQNSAVQLRDLLRRVFRKQFTDTSGAYAASKLIHIM